MTPVQELRFLILAAQRTGSRMMAAVLKPLGLTAAQAEVLQVLAQFGPMSLNTLGGLLVCESGSPSRLAASLVDKGLVARATDPQDRRGLELSLTPKGLELLAKAAKTEPALADRIAGRLTAAEIDGLNAALHKLVEGEPAGNAVARRKLGR